jgi:flagellar motility protein MotE (MotC chaperone)
MAQAVKRPAKGDPEDDVQQAQTVDELEKEMLGPKAPKGPKEKKQKAPKEKKPLGKFEVAVLASLLWLAILGALALLILFDPTPDRVIRGGVLLLINPEEETREEYWMADIFELQDWQRELDEAEQELNARSAELDHREEELDEREAEIDEREIEIEDKWDAIRDNVGNIEGIMGDASEAARTLERMQPRNAAQTLEEMDFDNALRVLLLISPKRRAPIFDVMDSEYRVELIDAMAMPPEDDFFEEWD